MHKKKEKEMTEYEKTVTTKQSDSVMSQTTMASGVNYYDYYTPTSLFYGI